MSKEVTKENHEGMWTNDGVHWYYKTPMIAPFLAASDDRIILRDGRSLHWHKQKAAIRYSMLRTHYQEDKQVLKALDREWKEVLGCLLYEERACNRSVPKEITDKETELKINALIYAPAAEADLIAFV